MRVALSIGGVFLAESTKLSLLSSETFKFEMIPLPARNFVPATSKCRIAPEPFFNEIEEGNVVHVATKFVAETAGSDKISSLCSAAVAFWFNMFSRHRVEGDLGEMVFLDVYHRMSAVATSVILTFRKMMNLFHEATPM